ncbi:unnamed protein product [Caenorhabditis nigoni]|uniref:Uncharacterized protein n=1 Tax=Caenorhabditis nigoni TaxID=1611254 RepID=A0A2G5SZW6_9PELO|nr:hypothetical protein B9Z55_025774 [Caenorhabditis nigoni]
MPYREPTEEDVANVLEIQGCTDPVIFAACRAIDMIRTFLKHKPFTRVMVAFANEYQFFEDHVLRYEVAFIDFYNGLLDRLEIRGNVLETHEEASELEEEN